MKKIYLILILSAFCFSVTAQDLFQLKFDSYQNIDYHNGPNGTMVKFPHDSLTLVMGGLNDWDGMNNYFNIFGSKLIVDNANTGIGGIQNIVLRREDGRKIFELFPRLHATLTPLNQVETMNNTTGDLPIN